MNKEVHPDSPSGCIHAEMLATGEGSKGAFDAHCLPLVEAAVSLALAGYYVFPIFGVSDATCDCGARKDCNPGKHPIFPWKKISTRDVVRIRQWWARYPNANIGIDCGKSGIVVLDQDPKNGGELSLKRILKEVPEIATAPSIATGSGGTHNYFGAASKDVRNSAGACPGIDVRGNGGYVVAAPSRHICGRRYAGQLPSVAELPPWPDSLASLLRKAKPANRAPKAQGSTSKSLAVGRIPVGERNAFLTSMAGRLRYAGIDEADAFAMLRADRDLRCDQPQTLTDGEIAAIVKSIYSNGNTRRSLYAYVENWLQAGVTGSELLFLCSVFVDHGRGILTPCLNRIEQVSRLSKKRLLTARKGVVSKGFLSYAPGINKLNAAKYSFAPLPPAGVETAPPDSAPIIKSIRGDEGTDSWVA